MSLDLSALHMHEMRQRLENMSHQEREAMLIVLAELESEVGSAGGKGSRLVDLLASHEEGPSEEDMRRDPTLLKLFTPNPGPQTAFIHSTVSEILYGGRAGGGKSAGLLICSFLHLMKYGSPKFGAILFRRTLAEVKMASFYELAMEKFSLMAARGYPAKFNKSEMTWDLGPIGKLRFGYLEDDGDHMRYMGSEYIFVGYDEATHLRPAHYIYLQSRMRAPVPCILRATSNPGGPAHQFIFNRFAPWLNRKPEYLDKVRRKEAITAAPGEVLWVMTDKEGKEHYVPQGTPDADSRTYIPASAEDTPQFDLKQYEKQLTKLDPLTRAQLKEGDWNVEPAAGTFFNRNWFTIIKPHDVPIGGEAVAKWDFAWTKKKKSDNTVYLRMKRVVHPQSGQVMYIVERVVVMKTTPGDVEEKLREFSFKDRQADQQDHTITKIVIPEDPSSGKYTAHALTNLMAGYNIRAIREDSSKKARAAAAASAAERRQIYLVDGDWNDDFLSELHNFKGKDGDVDDQVDCLSGAFNFLTMGESEDLIPTETIDKAVDEQRVHPYSVEVLEYPKWGRFSWEAMVTEAKSTRDWCQVMPILNPKMPRHFHIQRNVDGRSGAVVMAHISEWRTVQRRQDGQPQEELVPVFTVDLALDIQAEGELPVSDLRALAYLLSDHGYALTSISCDPFEELESVPALKQRGFNGQMVDVNKDDAAAYRTLKVAFQEERIKMYPYDPLLRELKSLDWNVQQRVIMAPLGRREIADALAGVVFTLSAARTSSALMNATVPTGTSLTAAAPRFEPFLMGGGDEEQDNENWMDF